MIPIGRSSTRTETFRLPDFRFFPKVFLINKSSSSRSSISIAPRFYLTMFCSVIEYLTEACSLAYGRIFPTRPIDENVIRKETVSKSSTDCTSIESPSTIRVCPDSLPRFPQNQQSQDLNLSLASSFPYDDLPEGFRIQLAKKIKSIKSHQAAEPTPIIVSSVLNTLLVWCGARPSMIPQSSTFPTELGDLVTFLNEASAHLTSDFPPMYAIRRAEAYIDDPTIVHRPQSFLLRAQRLSTSRLGTTTPLSHYHVGLELGMYERNSAYFQYTDLNGLDNYGFIVFLLGYENELLAMMFAEVWHPDALTGEEIIDFVKYCERRVRVWNTVMERLELTYRFEGRMERSWYSRGRGNENLSEFFFPAEKLEQARERGEDLKDKIAKMKGVWVPCKVPADFVLV